MYFSNAVIDRVVEKLPEVFNFHSEVTGALLKETWADADLGKQAFPVEPVVWPVKMGAATIESRRGHGAIAIVHGGGSGLVVQLNNGVKHASFSEAKYVGATMHVTTQSGTVLDGLEVEGLWSSVADNIQAPKLSNLDGCAADVELEQFVREGKHVEGVAARIIALALEHALVPFTRRTKVRNAASCYWCVGRTRGDGINYSVPSPQELGQWSAPHRLGRDSTPTAVVWVGAAHKVKGMALLSRIMDAQGPLMLQQSFLCSQFPEGQLLMAGTGALPRDLKAVQPEHLNDAIDEALWLLVEHNNLDIGFIRNTLRLMVRNLTVLDTAHMKESRTQFWDVQAGSLRQPALPPDKEVVLQEVTQRCFSRGALVAAGIADPGLTRGVMSDLFRREVLSPLPGMDSLAPSTVVWGGRPVCALLACMQGPSLGMCEGQEVYVRSFDITAPPAVPDVDMPSARDLEGLHLCFSGRAAYAIYAYTIARVNGVVVVPDGWARAPPHPDPPQVPDQYVGQGEWIVWRGGYDANGDKHTIGIGLCAYCVRQWVPSVPFDDGTFLNGHVPPQARLKKFDVPRDFVLSVNKNGAFPDIAGVAPKTMRYVADNSKGRDPLDLLVTGNEPTMLGLDYRQRSLAIIVGVAYCWEAYAGVRVQNDAYARWVGVHRVDCRLTTTPDELKVFVGGVRSYKELNSCGGLWTLCYQERVPIVRASSARCDATDILRNRSKLAAYILKLRSAVEMSDQLLRISNCRLRGCLNPALWDDSVHTRLEAAGIDEPLGIEPGTYLARQACMLAALFDHPDAVVARTFGVVADGTLRLRESVAGKGWDTKAVQHMNWLTPQCLSTDAWIYHYGIAAPSFELDSIGRQLLNGAAYSGHWTGVSDKHSAGCLVSPVDELWCSVLTSFVGNRWLPAVLDCPEFGQGLSVCVGGICDTYSGDHSPIMMRLNLPCEARLRAVIVDCKAVNRVRKPVLNHRKTPNWVNGAVLPSSDVAYGAAGEMTGVYLRGGPPDMEVLDFQNTNFCQDGISFKPTKDSEMLVTRRALRRGVGDFWVVSQARSSARSAGISAGGQRTLSGRCSQICIGTEHDSNGTGIGATTIVNSPAPDVSKLATGTGVGARNAALREVAVGTGLLGRIRGLSTISEEGQEAILDAFARVGSVGTVGAGRSIGNRDRGGADASNRH